MSATAAASAFMGAKPHFVDVDYDDFNMDVDKAAWELRLRHAFDPVWKAIVVTNLFGTPARLKELRDIADEKGILLIEDNAQSILAKEEDRYAGTIGHIGVFSLNVHKHIQCGEGGIVVTDDDRLADRIRAFVNHGEMSGGPLGLNLRLSEVSAAIAIAQLERVDEIVSDRVAQAEKLKKALIPFNMWAEQPKLRPVVNSVYYTIPFRYHRLSDRWPPRGLLLKALAAEGVPLVGGYVEPLTRLPAFFEQFQYAEGVRLQTSSRAHDEWLFYFSNCEWTLPDIGLVREAFQKVWNAVDNDVFLKEDA